MLPTCVNWPHKYSEWVVQEVQAQLGHDPQCNRGGRCRRPTPCPKLMCSVERKEVKPVFHMPFRHSWHRRSSSTNGHSRSRGEPTQCYRCKGFRHFAKDCPSDGFYHIGPNDLPIRNSDPCVHSFQDSRPARTRLPPPKLGGGCPESPTGNPIMGTGDIGSCDKGSTKRPVRDTEPVKAEIMTDDGA